VKAVHAVSRSFSVEQDSQSLLSSSNSNKTPATPSLRASKRDMPTNPETQWSNLAAYIRQMGRLLTAEQLALLMECSKKYVYALVKQRRLPAIRIGSLIRFDPQVTADWLESRMMR
jgi:excisionase family DNA binding protein